MIRRSVAVDDQPRIALQHRGRVKHIGKCLGHRCDADVPGDVAGKFDFVEAQFTKRARDQAAGMIGGQKKVREAPRLQNADRGGLVAGEEIVHLAILAGCAIGRTLLGRQFNQ